MGSYISAGLMPFVPYQPSPPTAHPVQPPPQAQIAVVEAVAEKVAPPSPPKPQPPKKLFSVHGRHLPRTIFDSKTFKRDRCYVVHRDRQDQDFDYTVYELPKCTVPAHPNRETIAFVNRTNSEIINISDMGNLCPQEMQFLISINTHYRNKMWAGDSARMVSPLTQNCLHVIYGVTHLCGSLLRSLGEQHFYTYDPLSKSLTVHLHKNPDTTEEEADQHTEAVGHSLGSNYTVRRTDLVLGTRGGYGPASKKQTPHRQTPYRLRQERA
ncbi:protein ORF77 [Cyprinid herpesvirus 1]|uniref:Protein ORF77 n=1 Tax=Cyprinid herpesvirus 1 TaxID=317858 RepID=K7PBD2_9VIRU|nr:protein ORF77 [Cyprinid herpesvirus 1]AFJ20374.1 protein ORF77 [Cyprinid herpesvirus 1]